MWLVEFIIALIFIISIISFFSLAPWVPTKNSDLKRVDDIVKLLPGERFLEMWCGTARVSIYLAKKYPESHIIGIELSPLFFIISKIKTYFSRAKNIEIIYGNALKKDLSIYDVIYVFWLPETISSQILPLIQANKSKNFRFISYCFKMKNDVFQETKYKTEKNFSIYEYKLLENMK